MEQHNKDLLMKKLLNYQKLLAKYDDDKLKELEYNIYNTNDEMTKITLEFNDIFDYKKNYNGIYNDVLTLLIKEAYSKLGDPKQYQIYNNNYNYIKTLLAVADILLGEDIGFFEALKYADLSKIKEFIEKVEDTNHVR